MKKNSLSILIAAVGFTASIGLAQTQLETFENGVNNGDWQLQGTFACNGNVIETSGGNPGAWLHNACACCFLPTLQPYAPPHPYSGDFRAMRVERVGFDMNTFSAQSNFDRLISLWLADDNGTPTDFGDDCFVFTVSNQHMPQPGAGWVSFEIDVPFDSTVLPNDWQLGWNCVGNQDAIWNSIVQGVDYVGFFLGDPTLFYSGNLWDVGIDNVRILGGLGDRFCPPTPNSSGGAALIQGTGSASIAANDLGLAAAPLPKNKSGLFFYGPNQIQIVFGNGFRCVGGALHRLPVLNSGPSGELVFPVDYGSLPAGGQIVAGATWNFQAWFRDPAAGGAFFDTSDAISILFVP